MAKARRLQVDLNIGAELSTTPTMVGAAEAAGFDGVTISETSRDAFLAATLALEHSRNIMVATEVAVAFPRSPMVTAMPSSVRSNSSRVGSSFSLP